MSAEPGRYGGYGVRPRPPGSARHWMDPLPEGWQRNIARAEAALAQPFAGVTTDGQVVPDLVPLRQTGISTRPIMKAAQAFVRLLDETQRRTALAINPTLFKQLPYDPVKDFVPILLYVKSPVVLIVHPSLPVKTVPELMELARTRPGELSYSASGIGGASRLGMEMTMGIYGVRIAQVPYKLSTQAISDVAAGHVHIGFAEAGATQALIRSGRLRALAVSSQTRFTTLPEIPTMAEAIKRPDFEAVSWHVLLAPSAAPAAVVKRLHGEMTQVIKLPEVHDRIAATGLMPQEPRSIEENRNYIAAETKKWGALIVKLGLAGTQ